MNQRDPYNPSDSETLAAAMKRLAHDIRLFIELSLREDDDAWEKWLPEVLEGLKIKCWKLKQCEKKDCPAFEKPNVRCWLTVGTMCGGKVQGDFALKYQSCTECEVYQKAVFEDPVVDIYEHLLTLIHSLREKQDRLKVMATRDLLTGLYNRNYFNETIAREIERAKRQDEDISVIMIDIDRFKQINDSYGHLHGDGMLRECASIIAKATRKSDIVCRFGGDEFLIVTFASDGYGHAAILSRIDEFVSEWNRQYASDNYRLSLSIGSAVLPREGQLMEALREADRLMYEDKRKKADHE
jgi:diguanylate cyclase (GGDEF)-like protein